MKKLYLYQYDMTLGRFEDIELETKETAKTYQIQNYPFIRRIQKDQIGCLSRHFSEISIVFEEPSKEKAIHLFAGYIMEQQHGLQEEIQRLEKNLKLLLKEGENHDKNDA